MKIVVVGAGDVGTYVTRNFSELGHQVVLVGKLPDKIATVEEYLDAMILIGNILHLKILQELNCATVDLFFSATNSNSTNIVAAGRAAALRAKNTVCRVDDPGYYGENQSILTDEFGITTTICATRILVLDMLKKIFKLDCEAVYDFCGYGLGLIQFKISEKSSLIDQPSEKVAHIKGCRCLGIIRNSTECFYLLPIIPVAERRHHSWVPLSHF